MLISSLFDLVYNSPPFVYTGRARSKASDDDDDFIVPSDSEVETRSIKSSSSRLSSASRRLDVASSEIEDGSGQDEDEELKKKKGKSSGKSRSSPAKGNSKALASSGGSATFLTAAERREQGKKEEKKAAESPYSFLADNVRDVSKLFFFVEFSLLTKCNVKQKEGRKSDHKDYDPGTLFIPPKAWSTFTPFEKQVRSFFSACRLYANLELVLGGSHLFF